MKDLRQLSISDLWAAIQFLREEIEYWSDDECLDCTKNDKKTNAEILQERRWLLEKYEEALNEIVFAGI